MIIDASTLARWRRDPVHFIETVLHDPEIGKPFHLYAGQREFIRRGFTLDKRGRLPYSELVFSGGKKSGKTATAALCGLYVAIVVGGAFAEVYCLSNDLEQSRSRVFQACCRILEASPMLRDSVNITKDKIVFSATKSFIQACASDYSGFAGANPSLSLVDELWGFVTESSQRLFDEASPPPTRKVSARLTTTYAGFSGDSQLLERLFKRGMEGIEVAPDLWESPGMLMRWAHDYSGVPWITQAWLDEMKRSLRPNQYLRLCQNEWVTSESGFLPMEDYDTCVDTNLRPVSSADHLPIWVGVDASVRRDATAVACVTYDYKVQRVVLVDHKIFTPTKDQPVDFAALEEYLLGLRRRFAVRMVAYDPYQFESISQRLAVLGLPLEPYPQTPPNLEATSSNLYDLFRYRKIQLYPDEEIRTAMSHAVAVETPRGGTRISKSRASHKIDIVAALSFACLMAIREGSYEWKAEWTPVSRIEPSQRSSGGWTGGGEPDRLYCSGEDYVAWEDQAATLGRNIRSKYGPGRG
jgi:hypothetical protein